MELNRTYQLVVYSDDIDLLSKNTNSTRNTLDLTDASKEGGLEVNAQKAAYIHIPSGCGTRYQYNKVQRWPINP
jgi:hypothetical protein